MSVLRAIRQRAKPKHNMPAIMETYRISIAAIFRCADRKMESRYFALTDQEGRFVVGGILPGTHKTVIRHL